MTGIVAISVDDSIEALFVEHGTASRNIYIAMIVLTIAALTAAALTSVDLTIRAPATLSASITRQTLRSTSDGIVERLNGGLGSRYVQETHSSHFPAR